MFKKKIREIKNKRSSSLDSQEYNKRWKEKWKTKSLTLARLSGSITACLFRDPAPRLVVQLLLFMLSGWGTQHLFLQQNQFHKILEQYAPSSATLKGNSCSERELSFLGQKVKKKKKKKKERSSEKYAKCFSWCFRRIQACSHSRPALGAGGAESTCGWPTCSEQWKQWLSLTACDYKFFPTQAAHTKTLKLQQKKGQSKPSSPSHYNKSLVPASVLALITRVQADENRNNSGHSKINLSLISPRLLLKIRAVNAIHKDWKAPLQISWDAQAGTLHIPHRKEKQTNRYTPCQQFLNTVYTDLYAHHSQCLCRNCLVQGLPSVITSDSDFR